MGEKPNKADRYINREIERERQREGGTLESAREREDTQKIDRDRNSDFISSYKCLGEFSIAPVRDCGRQNLPLK